MMLEIKNVSVSYGRKEVLNNVCLSLHEGVYGLLGPNGSGKTTLMRCIAGILNPTSGTISRSSKAIGYLPQKFGMYKELTVYETLQYFASLKGVVGKQQRDMIMDCLDQVHLADKASTKIQRLSGGMVRRVGIAQALLGNPSVVLVDEPTTGLDPEERIRFKNLISKMQKGRTVLISTHIVEDVDALCDRIIILNRGKVLIEGSADELKKKAKGKVYRVNAEHEDALCSPYYITRDEHIDNQRCLRILSQQEQPGILVPPSVEDGYMLLIHETL